MHKFLPVCSFFLDFQPNFFFAFFAISSLTGKFILFPILAISKVIT